MSAALAEFLAVFAALASVGSVAAAGALIAVALTAPAGTTG